MSEESKEYWKMVRDQALSEVIRLNAIQMDREEDEFKPSMSALRLRRLDAQERHETGGSVYD